jgi:hypothetical protein
MTWVRARLCKLQKGCTRLAAASDKVYQLHAHGRWFSPGTLAFSTTKTGRHYIAEILLKMALSTKIQIQIQILICKYLYFYIYRASNDIRTKDHPIHCRCIFLWQSTQHSKEEIQGHILPT